MTPVSIPLNKQKLLPILLGALGFVGAGFWLLLAPPAGGNELPLLSDPVLIAGLGVAAILFFGAGAVLTVLKMRDRRPGLTIDAEGILDNSSGISAGLVRWDDIEAVDILRVMNQRFLVLYLRNPEAHIARQQNGLKRWLMRLNWKSYGSPVHIPASGLETNLDDLYALVRRKFEEYRAGEALA